MSLIDKIILVFIGSFALSSCSDTEIKYDWESSNNLIEKYQKCNQWIDNPGTEYDFACNCEQMHDLQFPTSEAAYGKLIYNNGDMGSDFTHDKSFLFLDNKFIEELRVITRDSSNYRWGELGTQYTGCIMEFYNKKDELINIATLTWGAMLSTTPRLTSIKWGLLNDRGEKAMFGLLDKYEKNKQRLTNCINRWAISG